MRKYITNNEQNTISGGGGGKRPYSGKKPTKVKVSFKTVDALKYFLNFYKSLYGDLGVEYMQQCGLAEESNSFGTITLPIEVFELYKRQKALDKAHKWR